MSSYIKSQKATSSHNIQITAMAEDLFIMKTELEFKQKKKTKKKTYIK